MINLDYTLPMIEFFKGISGMNFQMYDFGDYLTFLDLPVTGTFSMGSGFEHAGFEVVSFI
jgi:hypothetical protein